MSIYKFYCRNCSALFHMNADYTTALFCTKCTKKDKNLKLYREVKLRHGFIGKLRPMAWEKTGMQYLCGCHDAFKTHEELKKHAEKENKEKNE